MMAAIYENCFYNGFNTPFNNRAYESTTVDSLFASLPDFKTKATDAWNGIAEGRFSGLAPLFEDGPFDDGKRTTTHGKTYIDDRFLQELQILNSQVDGVINWPHQHSKKMPPHPSTSHRG